MLTASDHQQAKAQRSMSEIFIDFERRLSRLEAIASGGSEIFSTLGPHDRNLRSCVSHTISGDPSSSATTRKIYQKQDLMRVRSELLLKNKYECPQVLRKYYILKTEVFVPPIVSRVVSLDRDDSEHFLSTSYFYVPENSLLPRSTAICGSAEQHGQSRQSKQVNDGFYSCGSPLRVTLHSSPATLSGHRDSENRTSRKKDKGHDKDSKPKVEYQNGYIVRSPYDV